MIYPDDLTREAILEILEWSFRPSLRIQGPYGDLMSNAEAVERWDQLHSKMSDSLLRAKLPTPEAIAVLSRMEAWTGEDFVAVMVGWPLELGSFLVAKGSETIGDGFLEVGIDNPARHVLFHVLRSKSHGLPNAHTPTEWLQWASERGLQLPDGFALQPAGKTEEGRSMEKDLTSREKKGLLRMIFALCNEAYGWEGDLEHMPVKDIEDALKNLFHERVEPSKKTIKKRLLEATDLHHQEKP